MCQFHHLCLSGSVFILFLLVVVCNLWHFQMSSNFWKDAVHVEYHNVEWILWSSIKKEWHLFWQVVKSIVNQFYWGGSGVTLALLLRYYPFGVEEVGSTVCPKWLLWIFYSNWTKFRYVILSSGNAGNCSVCNFPAVLCPTLQSFTLCMYILVFLSKTPRYS